MNGVEISELHEAIARRREAVRDLLDSTEDPRCQGLSDSLRDELGDTLAIALIGQYNAGKSSIVKALAPIADVVIDANVATDRVVDTIWHGLRLVDTPGVRAGRPVHDDLTEQAIASSDLLVFVVTADLFDATIAEYFRSIVIDQARASECILVVNKSTQDAGDPQVKRAQIADVLHPLSTDDVPVLFIDARARLWAEEAIDDEREEYLRLSNFHELTTAIDTFARRSGLRGRLTTPAYQAIDVVDRALESLAVDDAIQTELDRLRAQRDVLLRLRVELEESARAGVASAAADLAHIGHEVAAVVQPTDDEQTLKLRVQEGQARADRRADLLDEELDKLVRATAQRVSDELQGSRPELTAGEAPGRARTVEASPDAAIHLAGPAEPWRLTSAEVQAGLKRIAAFFGDNARPGQPGHALIYKAGKALRVKFKPWGAVKLARRMGKAAEGLGSALVVLEIVNEQRQERVERWEADRMRALDQAIRSHFVTYSDVVRTDAEHSITAYVESSYGAALASIDAASAQLVRQRTASDGMSAALIGHREELVSIVQLIHGAELEASSDEERAEDV